MSDKQRWRERDRQGMTNEGIVMNTKNKTMNMFQHYDVI